jgi:hypothetical protein
LHRVNACVCACVFVSLHISNTTWIWNKLIRYWAST